MTTEDRNDLVVRVLYKLRDESTDNGSRYFAFDEAIDLLVNDAVLEQYVEEVNWMERLTNRQKLIGCRKMLNLTQEDMAKVLGINRITYHKKEKRTELFTLEESRTVQEYFDLTLENAPRIFS